MLGAGDRVLGAGCWGSGAGDQVLGVRCWVLGKSTEMAEKCHEYGIELHAWWFEIWLAPYTGETMIRNFRDLEVWQRSMQLVDAVYDLVPKLPRSEQFILLPQMTRAAISIPSNIAEGHARLHLGDYIHHLSIAPGSLAEVETLLEIAKRRLYFTSEDIASASASVVIIGKMLNRLIVALRKRKS